MPSWNNGFESLLPGRLHVPCGDIPLTFPIIPSAEFSLPASVQTSLQPLLPGKYQDQFDAGNINQYDPSANVTMIVPKIFFLIFKTPYT